MNILLTGVSGTLGQRLQEVFPQANVDVAGRQELNLADLDSITNLVARKNPDVIINAAAYNDVDGAESHRDLAMVINGQAPGLLARAARAVGAYFVHFSSDYVFDGSPPGSYDEQAVTRPISIYGESKALGERLVLAAMPQAAVIRTSRLFGEWSDTGQNKPSFVRLILERSKKTDHLEVVADETTSPTYARDLALATVSIVEQRLSGLFHRTNDGACTWYELAEEVLSNSRWHGKLVPVAGSAWPRPAKRPASSILLSTRLPVLRSWQNALQDHLNRIKAIT